MKKWGASKEVENLLNALEQEDLVALNALLPINSTQQKALHNNWEFHSDYPALSPVGYAILKSNPSLLAWLLDQGASPTQNIATMGASPIISVLGRPNDHRMMELLLSKNPKLKDTQTSDEKFIHRVLFQGSLACLEACWKRGITTFASDSISHKDIDLKNRYGLETIWDMLVITQQLTKMKFLYDRCPINLQNLNCYQKNSLDLLQKAWLFWSDTSPSIRTYFPKSHERASFKDIINWMGPKLNPKQLDETIARLYKNKIHHQSDLISLLEQVKLQHLPKVSIVHLSKRL